MSRSLDTFRMDKHIILFISLTRFIFHFPRSSPSYINQRFVLNLSHEPTQYAYNMDVNKQVNNNKFKPERWAQIAKEVGIPWEATASMHCQLGEQEMARRAGPALFSLRNIVLDAPSKRIGKVESTLT